jgi:hypothetical protein
MQKFAKMCLVSAFISLTFVGCNRSDEGLIPTSSIAKGVSLSDDRIVFASLNDFKSTIESLKKMNEGERAEWESKIGHRSMQTYYSAIEGVIIGESNPIYKSMTAEKPYIPDVLFARIVNQDGIFQIGKEVHRITNDGQELVTDEANKKLLLANTIDSKVTSHKISVVLDGARVVDNKKNARTSGTELPVAAYGFDDTHAAIAYFARSNYWIYNSFAMKLKMSEYRGWWIFKSWQPINATYLEVTSASFSYNEPFNPCAGVGSASCNDCNEAYAFLTDSCYGPTTYTTNWSINGSFKVTYNGQTQTFTR